jgi:hypothetical protein
MDYRGPEDRRGPFVTVRTVEFHLSRAYDKLEIHSRAELAPALEVQGSEPSPATDACA